jgi:NTE family protein
VGYDVAFVLGGGGVLGATEVGMIRALHEAGVRPDLVLGTSVGALNGVAVAADPDSAADRLTRLWEDIDNTGPFGGTLAERAVTLARSRTHLHEISQLRELVEATLTVRRFEDLVVPFQCVAASIERAGPRWFDSGPLVEAVLASAAVPGIFPPVEIDGEHHYDGGLVHSIPLGRAVTLGARTVYVLQVGRIDTPLEPPSNLLDVGLVAFEVARRHRFVEELAQLPADVDVHVLPTGEVEGVSYDDPRTPLRYRDTSQVAARIDAAYVASRDYLTTAG